MDRVPSRYRQNPRTAGRVIDGLAFVVTPDDNKLHTLNRTSSHLWALLEAACTIDELADGLQERFDVETQQARDDVATFCKDMVARGILEAA